MIRSVYTPFKFFLVSAVFFLPFISIAQNKVSITTTNPSAIHLCAESEWLEIDIRNITTSTVSSIKAEVVLPTGMQYVSGTISGTGVSESNISNLQKPVFSLPDLSLAKSSTFRLKIMATCSMISWLSSGGLPQIKTTATYSGGSTSATGTPLTIYQPSVKITAITNQFATIDRGKATIRKITITNGGKGNVASLVFRQIHEKDLSLTGVSGGSISKSGDTAWSSFNKALFTTVGNKDSFLSQGESVEIIDTVYAIGCSKLKTYFNVTWGCNGSVCSQDNASANISITTKAPKLTYTAKSATTNCQSDVNHHLQELTLVNSGTDTARKLVVNIFQGVSTGYYQYEMSRIDESNITYQIGSSSFSKIYSGNTLGTYTGGAYACLGNSAVGSVELSFADLPPGESIHIKFYTIGCCPSDCGASFYAHRWKYNASYKNQCGTTITDAENFGSLGIYQGFGMLSYTPTDIIDNQTLELNYSITAASLLTPTSSGTFTAILKLPAGLSHSKNKSDFLIENEKNQSWQPTSIYQKSDTVFAIFKGTPTISLVRSELKIKVTGDCSSTSANKEQSYSLDILYNPDPSCSSACAYHLYCFSSKIRIHCNKTCNSGLRFSEFDARRITYGEPDNNNDGEADASGTLDMSRIKLERVMVGDTLLTTLRGKINAVGSTTTWRYLKAATTMDYGYYMKVAEVRLKIYRVGNLLYNCNGISHTYSTSGYSKTFTFDIGVSALISAKCPLYSGFLFTTKDSVELEVKYVYETNPGGVNREVLMKNEMYLSTVSNPTAAQRYQCDTFGGKFVQIGYYFTNYGRGVYSTNSCNEFEVSQNYYLGIGACCSNYAGNNIFPYEYRNWAIAKRSVLILPEGFDVVNARFYQYRTTGSGSASYTYNDSIKKIYVSRDTVVYDLESYHTPSGGNLIPSDDGFYGVVYYKLRANCAASQGVSTVMYDFVMDGQNQLSNVLDTVQSLTNSDDIQYEKPTMVLGVEQNDIKAKSDTAEWNIRISNSSGVSNAKNVWISYAKNNNTRITEIKYRYGGTTISPTNDIFRLGDLYYGETIDLVVRAVFSKCGADSFPLYVGYDCVGYPDSFAQFPCSPVVEVLKYTPVNTRLSASVKDSLNNIDLCAQVPFTITVTNEGEARVFDVYADVIIREGMTFSDTAWGFEPGTNDSFPLADPLFIGNNTYRFYISSASTSLKQKGLAGFSTKEPNVVKMKFYMFTDCDFVSSSYFLVRPGGNLRCGMPVITSYGVGQPINIKGVEKPYFSSFNMNIAPLDICNYDGKIRIKFINLGPDTTGNKDKIQLLLPDGIFVDTSYLISIHNSPASKPVITNNGQYKAEWDIPMNTIPGDSSEFEINTYVVPALLPCGYTQIIGQAVVKQPALCVATNTMCNIDVATSSQLIIDSIQKSIYQLSLVNAISVPNGNREKVTLTYNLSNSGSQKIDGNALVVKYLDDVNGNLHQDAGEAIVHTDTIWQKVDVSNPATVSATFNLRTIQSCRLVLLIDSTNCVCDATSLQVPGIRIINAGRDTAACAYTDITIGTASIPGCTYSWSPANQVLFPDSSSSVFNYTNLSATDSAFRLILTTDKGSCKTTDTAFITLFPAMQMDLAPGYDLCRSDSVIIGDLVKGGKGFKSYQWSPDYAINNPNSVKVWAKPDTTTTYTIRVADARGCKMVDSTTVRVLDIPIASFSIRDTCAGELFPFVQHTKTGLVGLDSVSWEFGNLGTSQDYEPVIYIDSAQRVDVRLFVRDSAGCFDDTVSTVTSYPIPEASFTPANGCQFDSVKLINTSSIASGTFTSQWTIEGSVLKTKDASFRSADTGIVISELKVTSNFGCSGVYSDTSYIYAKPVLKLSVNEVCLGDSTKFQLQNIFGSDMLSSVLWKLGDGNSDTLIEFTHVFADTGSFSNTAIIITNKACSDTAMVQNRVHEIPVASLSAIDVCLSEPSMYKNKSVSYVDSITSVYWNSGSGYFKGSDSLSIIWPDTGNHVTNLIAETSFGCRDTAQIISRTFYKEIPNYTITGNCQYSEIEFTYSPQFTDSIKRIEWKVKPNDTLTGNDVVTDYDSYGKQNITLIITTNHNCLSDTSFEITIDPKPFADFTTDLPCLDNESEISDITDNGLSPIIWRNWDLGDGTYESTADVHHVYDSIKTYSLTLMVENDKACRDTVSKALTIETIVRPDFSIDSVCISDSVTVKYLTSGLPMPGYYTFDMGDGSTVSNQPQFKHSYSTDGTFQVKLTVSTSADCSYDTTKTTVLYPLPVPGFDLDPPSSDILNSDITIINRSTGASEYYYLLSDGSEFTDPGFTYHFSDSGTYVIHQLVTNPFGCKDSTDKSLHINYLVNILIPNSFTPNGDGLNELFQPGGLGVVQYDLSIYNRWGEMIYHSDTQPWDGKDAMMGVYMYALKVVDYNGKTHFMYGEVHLIR